MCSVNLWWLVAAGSGEGLCAVVVSGCGASVIVKDACCRFVVTLHISVLWCLSRRKK